MLFKKFFQWIRKCLGYMDLSEAEAEVEESEIIFPDAKTLRKETWENTPYATDRQILDAINKAKADHKFFARIWDYRITDTSKEALEKKEISIEIYNGPCIGFKLKW